MGICVRILGYVPSPFSTKGVKTKSDSTLFTTRSSLREPIKEINQVETENFAHKL